MIKAADVYLLWILNVKQKENSFRKLKTPKQKKKPNQKPLKHQQRKPLAENKDELASMERKGDGKGVSLRSGRDTRTYLFPTFYTFTMGEKIIL